MNILLIRPKPHKESIGLQSFMICEPLELEYLSSYLESFGHKVDIIDMILEHKSIQYYLNKFKPHFAGLTGYITHVGVIKEYSKKIKLFDKNIITLAGGIHAEVVPEDFEDPYIDFIIHVNGMKTFKEIIDNSARGKEYILNNVDGVWLGSNTTQNNKKTYLIEKEFNYSHPDRNKTNKYRSKYNYIFHNKCAIVKTSFGCPYKCNFCFCIKITRNNYFERNLEDVIEELKEIKEKNIFIVDDDFLLKKERVLEFCSLLEKNNINKRFILFGRSDFIVNNEDVIKLFNSKGLQAVFMGIESFRKKELEQFNKRITVDENVNAIKILEKYSIECHAGIIVGHDWGKEDFNNLINWINKFKMLFVNIQPLTPMPGTELYDKLKNKIFAPRKKYEQWDMAHIIIKPEKMSVRHFYYNIIRAYLKTTTGIKGHIYIFRNYGIKTYFRTLTGSLYISYQYFRMILRG